MNELDICLTVDPNNKSLLVYKCIKDYADKNMNIVPSARDVMTELNICEKTYYIVLKRLIDAGYIKNVCKGTYIRTAP